MGKMQLPEEFKEFINLLNKNCVKYLLLGGWAVGYYSNPRATKDIDFLVFIYNSNLKKLEKVFKDFKSPPVNIEKDVFALHNSFKKNPLTNKIYDVFKYKILRKKIYDEIEYRYKLLLKNEYSYLRNNNK